MDRPARRGTATPRGRGRRRPARRLLPAPGAPPRRYASAWRPTAPLPAGTDARAAASHACRQHGTDFHHAAAFQDGTALRELHGFGEIFRLDQGVAADDVLRLGVRAVGDGALLALDQLARPLERMTGVLDVALVGQLLHPGHPGLHALLHLLRRSHRGATRLVGAAVQVNEFAHGNSSRVSPIPVLVQPASDLRTFQGRCSGHGGTLTLTTRYPARGPSEAWTGDAPCLAR